MWKEWNWKSNLSNNSSNQIRVVNKNIINYKEDEEIDNDDKDEKGDENGTHDE